MNALQIARLIANYSLFLDQTDDDVVDPDLAVEGLETLGADLDDVDKAFLRELVDAFAVITSEYSGEQAISVRDLAHDFSLEETIAEDDPVRLAELQARWEATDRRLPRPLSY